MPPVEFTPEEQAKVNAYLKEHGFENADPTSLLKNLRGEAQTHRERADGLDKTLKDTLTKLETYEKTEAERKAEDDKRKAEDAKKKEEEENAKKTLEERLADIESKFDLRIREERVTAEKERTKLERQIVKRDERILTDAVRAAAERKGLIELDFVRLLDLKDIKVEDGVPDYDAIQKLVDEHATAKPHLYKESNGNVTPFQRPTPERQSGGNKGPNWANLDPAEFDRQEALLRRGRM